MTAVKLQNRDKSEVSGKGIAMLFNYDSNNSTENLELVTSTAASSAAPPGYAFRERGYALVRLAFDSLRYEHHKMCLDTSCGMSLIDKDFLQKMRSIAKFYE